MNDIVAKHNKIKVSNEHGSIEIKKMNSWLGEIEKFFVEEKYRGNGIGKSILQDAELKAKEWDIKKLSLLCRVDNRPALNLYLKKDYMIEGLLKNHFENKIHMYILSKYIGKNE